MKEERILFFAVGHVFHLQFVDQLLHQFFFIFAQITLGLFLEHDEDVYGLFHRREIHLDGRPAYSQIVR